VSKENAPQPPRELRNAGKKLWVELHEMYADFSPHETALLVEACKISDRLAALNAVVDREGPLIESVTSGESRAHPALVELRQQQITLARIFAAMRLPDSDGLTPQRRQARGIYTAKRLQQLRGGA
jgi:hypothetical protein